MPLFGEVGYALIASSGRRLGTIIPDVVIEEAHRDSLIITQHPVEKGAAITDHAFMRPAEYDMRCGFSDSSAGYVGYARETYQRLLALQKGRQPQTIYTGKRVYRNMLFVEVAVVTDKHSENILLVQCRLQEVIIVSTRTTNTGTGTGTTKAGSGSPDGTGGAPDKGSQAGSPVGDQSFAGAVNPGFNPGNFNTEGGTLPNGSFGDGISPSGGAEVTLPEQSVSPGDGGLGGGGEGSNIWEFG